MAELVIKIDDQTYNHFVHNEYSRTDVIAIHTVLVNGAPIPDNATNGDVIKALFPKIDDNFSNVIDLKLWWDAKYQTESLISQYQRNNITGR